MLWGHSSSPMEGPHGEGLRPSAHSLLGAPGRGKPSDEAAAPADTPAVTSGEALSQATQLGPFWFLALRNRVI